MARATASLFPQAAGRLAAHLFLSTARPPLRLEEAAVLAQGRSVQVPFGDTHLAAWIWGEAEAPTVLLAHGWRGRAGQLTGLVAPLLARGARVVAFDGPGHGASPGSSATIPQMARAIAAVVDHVDDVTAVVAHSVGAVAATLALWRGLPAWRAAFIAPTTTPGRWITQFADALSLPAAAREPMRLAVEARAGMSVEALSPLRLAPALRSPLLVVHDRDDREAPLAEGEALAAAWPGAVIERTEGLGHKRILRDPAVIERVAAFVAP